MNKTRKIISHIVQKFDFGYFLPFFISNIFYHFKRSPEKPKIAYLLESTKLYGGVKVVFMQAKALKVRGYDTTVISDEQYPDWLEAGIGFVRQDPFNKNISNEYDYIITAGVRLTAFHYNHQSRAKLLHLCQGYEGSFKEAEPFLREIEAAYQLDVPRIVISEQLGNLLKQKFNMKNVHNVGQGLEHKYFFPNLQNLNMDYCNEINLFLFGHLHIDVKQIKTGLMVFAETMKKIPQLKLIRVSLSDDRQEERVIANHIQEYHVNIPPEKVGELLRNKPGILLALSKEGEGFGLPPLEAMACGMPTVMTKISSFLAFDSKTDYAEFVEAGNTTDIASGINEVIHNKKKRQHLIMRGIEVAQNYSYENVAERLHLMLSNYDNSFNQ